MFCTEPRLPGPRDRGPVLAGRRCTGAVAQLVARWSSSEPQRSQVRVLAAPTSRRSSAAEHRRFLVFQIVRRSRGSSPAACVSRSSPTGVWVLEIVYGLVVGPSAQATARRRALGTGEEAAASAWRWPPHTSYVSGGSRPPCGIFGRGSPRGTTAWKPGTAQSTSCCTTRQKGGTAWKRGSHRRSYDCVDQSSVDLWCQLEVRPLPAVLVCGGTDEARACSARMAGPSCRKSPMISKPSGLARSNRHLLLPTSTRQKSPFSRMTVPGIFKGIRSVSMFNIDPPFGVGQGSEPLMAGGKDLAIRDHDSFDEIVPVVVTGRAVFDRTNCSPDSLETPTVFLVEIQPLSGHVFQSCCFRGLHILTNDRGDIFLTQKTEKMTPTGERS